MKRRGRMAAEALDEACCRRSAPQLVDVVQDQNDVVTEQLVQGCAETGGECLRAQLVLARSPDGSDLGGRSGTQDRTAAATPRANLGSLLSCGPAVCQAQLTSFAHSASKVLFPNPAPATIEVSRFPNVPSSRLSSSGRRRIDARPLLESCFMSGGT